MPGTRAKTIGYRRAVWLSGKHSMEKYVRDAHGPLKAVGDRMFERGSGQIVKGLRFEPDGSKGVYLQITAETPGEPASVLSKKDEASEEGQVGVTAPPDGSEFMDGDIFAYVRGNHVCICSTGIRDGGASFFLRELFEKAKLGKASTQFDLQKIADVKKIGLIVSEGVREIWLGASLYDATVKYVKRRNQPAGALDTFARHFGALFKDDEAPLESVNVGLSLTLNRRRKKGVIAAGKRLTQIARDVVSTDEGDDYQIITGGGQKISSEEILLRRVVEVKGLGKSVDPDHAWKELRRFYADLSNSGALNE